MIVTNPGKRPASLRADQLVRNEPNESKHLEVSENTIPTHWSSSFANSEPSELYKSARNCKLSEGSKRCDCGKHSEETTALDQRRTWSMHSRSPELSRHSKASCSYGCVPSKGASSSLHLQNRKELSQAEIKFPEIVHFRLCRPQLSSARKSE